MGIVAMLAVAKRGAVMKTRENLLLVQTAYRRLNGANIHRGTAIIQAYRNAITLATDPRCRNKRSARVALATAEGELQRFCHPMTRGAVA